MKIGILGAGISGLSCASILAEKKFDVVVFERENQIGGLCRSKVSSGYVFDMHGGHVFNSNYNYVKEWVFSKLGMNQWNHNIRNAKILYDGNLMSYPFELALAELPVNETIDCLVDFVKPKGKEPNNYHDWLIWNFGQAIAEKYMIPYNTKLWSYPLKEMSIDWVKGKMPLPTIREVITATLTKNPEERKMPHSTFYYPLRGGIQTLIDLIARDTPDIRSNTPVESIERIKDKWLINGECQFDRVISTIPLKELAKVFDLPGGVRKAIDDLKFNSITTTICESSQTDLSWLYIPSKIYKAHRLVCQGNFAPDNCPLNKSSATIETIGKIKPEDQVNEFRKNIQSKEIQIGNIIDTLYTLYAYIVFDKNFAKNIEIVNSYFNDLNFTLLGRFAEWQYYNMDVCINRAFEVIAKLEQEIGR